MFPELSIETESQCLNFSTHQGGVSRRWFDGLASAKLSRGRDIDRLFSRVCKTFTALVIGHFKHQGLGKALRGIDAHLLNDIRLNHCDIEHVRIGRRLG